MLWIPITIFAALMQTVRSAIQKHQKGFLPTEIVAWVRFCFAIPFVLAYLLFLLWIGQDIPELSLKYLIYCLILAHTQILGTVLFVSLFSHRNFAIVTTYASTETLQTALLGILLFGQYLPIGAMVAIIIGFIGVILISLVEKHIRLQTALKGLTHKPALIGLASGTCFALTALLAREAMLLLSSDQFAIKAAFTLMIVVLIQTITFGAYLSVKHKGFLSQVAKHMKTSTIIGATSMLGSISWATAFALAQSAYVVAVGQISMVFTLFVTHNIFKEQINRKELLGIGFVVASIVLLVFMG